jgi:hypothetical protein
VFNRAIYKIALMKTLTASRANELRNLGALAYKTRCKREDWVSKVVLRLGGGEELDCWAINNLDETRTCVNIIDRIFKL